jgi:hypothetical protein
MSYEVEVKRTGRGGWAEYREDGRGLRFNWDINAEGAEIYVPPSHKWNIYCEEQGALWATGRRQAILERVAQEYCRQRASKAKWRIEDHWIFISFEPYFIHRFLNKVFGS